MKFIQQNLKILFVALSFTFMACSSDDDGGPTGPGGGSDNSVNSYTVNIEGEGEFSNSWELGDGSENYMAAVYITEDGDEFISLTIQDDNNGLNLSGGLILENDQALPLGDVNNGGWDEDLGVSGMVITFDNFLDGYSSVSGSVDISNLEVQQISSAGGAAAFDLELDGTFDIISTEEVEQINITGTFRFSNGLF